MARRLAALALVAALAACEAPKPTGVPVEATVGGNAGLGADVEVIYDGLGIPHIYAATDGDGAYALGYVHARDRLFQMDFYRRAGRGKLSELFGPATLAQDITLRTVFTGIRPLATTPVTYEIGRVEDLIAADLAAADPQLAAVAQRYADGVNRYIEDLMAGKNGARWPVEYILATGTLPPPDLWTVQDSIALGRLFSFQLSFDADADVAVGRATLALGCASPGTTPYQCAVLADLTRSAPAVASIVLPPAAPPPVALQAGVAAISPVAASLEGAAAAVAGIAGFIGTGTAGSNNWVLAGSRTATGMPLLANDPHLGFENPPIFYLVQLSTPTRDVAGVSFPGAPIVEIGHNGKVAWGATVAGYDVSDTFVEAVQMTGPVPTAALHGTTFQTIPVLNETFGVRNRATQTIATQIVPIPIVPWHGPILLDSINTTTTPATALSVQWTGQRPTQDVLAFWRLNGAATVDEAFTALTDFAVGAQNFVLADSAGNIGYDPHAWVPVRPALPDCLPWAPMPGDGHCDWTGTIADNALPQAKNPSQGWVATANNDITGATVGTSLANPPLGPPYLYYTRDLGYRHARIAGRLTERTGGYTLDDMTSIQADVHSLFAQNLVPALLAWWGSGGCTTTGAAGSCADALASRNLTTARDLISAWAAGPQPFATPTGLATSNPAGPKSADASELQAAAASMIFHALVPRLARRILDDDLVRWGYSVNSWIDSQLLAKYLVALGGYAPGRTTPAPPLATEAAGQSLCRVYTGGTPPFGNETCADMAVLALGDAVAFLSTQPEFGPSANPQDWLWGRLHRAYIRSRLSPTTTLLDYGPFSKHGGLHTVDVANFGWSNDGPGGFIQGSGANVRFSVQLGSSIRWRAVIPGGQSGFAGDSNYMDQIPAYLANQPGDQPYTPAEVQAAARRSLRFTP